MNIKTILSQIFQNKNIRFWGLQVFLALFLLFGGIYAVLLSLDGFTRHGEFVIVPDLEHVSLSKAQELLDKSHLRYEVRDSTAYNKDYPPYTIMKQNPEANEKVKKDRKIYQSYQLQKGRTAKDYPTPPKGGTPQPCLS